ncbi:MAG: DUF4340 domain-containing protein [Oligoflexia bacterium]|nr:DUF4340 domain-containing protein [Oligoflexia bacterium]
MKTNVKQTRSAQILPLITMLLTLFLGSCTRGCGNATSPTAESASGKVTGHPALNFDYRQATGFLFTAHDPVSGDRWTTRIVRETPADLSGEGGVWKISLAPDGRTLSDTWANGNWILHLLDTVRTAQLSEAPFSGSLESFGLSDPRVALRWTVGSSDYELHLGAAAKDGGFYGLIAQSPLAPASIRQKIYVVQGAVIQMLEMISTFDSLRLRTLATFSADDVDSIEIFSNGKTRFSSKRDGDGWTRSADTTGFLGQLCHLRIQNFIDDLDQEKNLARSLDSHPMYVIELKGRSQFHEKVRLIASQGHAYASVSSRTGPDALPSAFEVPTEILGALAVLLR